MSIEGIWTGEVYGPFGWENRGIFVFENGRIIGGDNRQYSTGSYGVSGEPGHRRGAGSLLRASAHVLW